MSETAKIHETPKQDVWSRFKAILTMADSELSAIAHGRPPSGKEFLIALSLDLRKLAATDPCPLIAALVSALREYYATDRSAPETLQERAKAALAAAGFAPKEKSDGRT